MQWTGYYQCFGYIACESLSLYIVSIAKYVKVSCVVEHDISMHSVKLNWFCMVICMMRLKFFFTSIHYQSPFQAWLIKWIYKGDIENCTNLFALSVVILWWYPSSCFWCRYLRIGIGFYCDRFSCLVQIWWLWQREAKQSAVDEILEVIFERAVKQF